MPKPPEPIPVLPLDYAPASSLRRPRWRRIVRCLIPLLWFGSVVAWVCIMAIDVETVLGSGPLLLAGGIVVFIGSVVVREPVPATAGLAQCAVCLLFFLLVILREWSPANAKLPFIFMGAVYLAASLPLDYRAWRRLSPNPVG